MIGTATGHPPDWRPLLWALLTGIVTLAAVSDTPQVPVSCDQHQGAFSAAFSTDFDVSSIDCKIGLTDYTVVIRFFRGTWPDVGIER